jgi:hypothetical protein
MGINNGNDKGKKKPDVMVSSVPGEPQERTIARALLSPSVQAAFTVKTLEKSDRDIEGLIGELDAQINAVNSGDMKRAEAILVAQAHTLNQLSNNLTRQALMQEYLPQYEVHLKLALKTQSQARATLETLAALKNPPVVYARQANVSTGPQQINNGLGVGQNDPRGHTYPHAGDFESAQNQLSEGNRELLPDTGTSAPASRANPALETLGEIDRAEVSRG